MDTTSQPWEQYKLTFRPLLNDRNPLQPRRNTDRVMMVRVQDEWLQ